MRSPNAGKIGLIDCISYMLNFCVIESFKWSVK